MDAATLFQFHNPHQMLDTFRKNIPNQTSHVVIGRERFLLLHQVAHDRREGAKHFPDFFRGILTVDQGRIMSRQGIDGVELARFLDLVSELIPETARTEQPADRRTTIVYGAMVF